MQEFLVLMRDFQLLLVYLLHILGVEVAGPHLEVRFRLGLLQKDLVLWIEAHHLEPELIPN